jgi:hypothetical protein
VGPASPPADASSGDADATGPAEEPGEVDAGEAGEAWPPGPEGEALAAAEERRAFEARVPEVGRALAQAADGNTRGALELLGTLAATFENDAHYHFELALLLDRAAQPLEAVRHAQRAVFLDPRYTGDAELHAVAERGLLAAASAETAARFLGLIVDAPLAERLVRFVLEPTGTLDAARRVHELLEHRDLLDGVSPYLRWSLLVVVTEDCASRRALLAEIAAAPDGRMWPYLRRFESETGCGRRKRNDCWPCERAALRGALAAVSGAAVVAGMSIDPVADAAP